MFKFKLVENKQNMRVLSPAELEEVEKKGSLFGQPLPKKEGAYPMGTTSSNYRSITLDLVVEEVETEDTPPPVERKKKID